CRFGLTSANRCGIQGRSQAWPRQTAEWGSAAMEAPARCSRPADVTADGMEAARPEMAEFPQSARVQPRHPRPLFSAPIAQREWRGHEPAHAKLAGRSLLGSRWFQWQKTLHYR